MPKFSQRNGYSLVANAFQRESVDDALRVKLWNVLKLGIWDKYDQQNRRYDSFSQRVDVLMQRLWFRYFNRDMDEMPYFYETYGKKGVYDIVKEYLYGCKWFEVYDLMEEMANDESGVFSKNVLKWINKELEEHNSAYRFIGSSVTEITDANEIHAIEDALTISDTSIKTHLEASLRMLSDRETPDYRNSIKESISAVEATCRLVTGTPSATLGEALKRITNLHPAMARAFAQLYGYTNDSSGIRHSLTDEVSITYADAKFMLITCSAFTSYLRLSSS